MSIDSPRPFRSRAKARPSAPNILFIVADDMGWADLGCYGNTEVDTPTLDSLARDGIRFTHAYSASPWCSPMRFGLYTGRNPGRLEAGLEEPLRTHNERNGIPPEHPTLPSLLAGVGYDTAMFGKWHCGWLPWFSPLRIGFGTFFGNLDGAMDYFEHLGTLGQPDLWEGETPVEMTGYYTDMISERGAEFVAAERDAPFYLQLNYTAPHWPWEGRGDAAEGARIRTQFETGEVPSPLLHKDAGSLAKYREMIETMDEGIGLVLSALAATGQADNTIVLFCSDNGGERWSKNWPFVGEKGDITEGGIRVPFILRWPTAVDPHQVSEHPNITMDWTATLIDAAGAEPHPDYPLDGVSLLGWLVNGDEYPDHDLFWRISSQSAMRRGPHKLVRSGRPRARLGNWPLIEGDWTHLYDVTVDGREAADLRLLRTDLVEEMLPVLDAMNAELLPYPPDHPGLPRRGTADHPAVSAPD